MAIHIAMCLCVLRSHATASERAMVRARMAISLSLRRISTLFMFESLYVYEHNSLKSPGDVFALLLAVARDCMTRDAVHIAIDTWLCEAMY